MIDVEQADGLWTLRINRPHKANSLTPEMLSALIGAVAEARAAQARALVITGTGERVFSSGADLDAAKAGLATSPLWEDLSGAVADLPCLTIAALNGTLAGGAFGMALACDLRLAVPGARFFYPVARLGFLPQPSDPGRLSALVGPARAKLILMAGEKIGADEALRIGLIDRIVPGPDLLAEATRMAQPARDDAAGVVPAIKQLLM